jgi:hypothetical protein
LGWHTNLGLACPQLGGGRVAVAPRASPTAARIAVCYRSFIVLLSLLAVKMCAKKQIFSSLILTSPQKCRGKVGNRY